MTHLQFRQWIVDTVNRTDVVVTSAHLHRWIASARRYIQQHFNFMGMEEIDETGTLTDAQIQISPPSDFKQEDSLRILATNGDPTVVMAKERSRNKFRRLVLISSAQAVQNMYKDLIIFFDTMGIEGYPLIYNIWKGKIEIFPKASGDAIGKTVSLDYFAYRQFDLSTLPAGAGATQMDGWEDFLFQDIVDLTYYRALIESGPFLRDNEQIEAWAILFKDKEAQLLREEIGKEQTGPTPYFGDG